MGRGIETSRRFARLTPRSWAFYPVPVRRGRDSAYGFLQIPPRDGAPLPSAIRFGATSVRQRGLLQTQGMPGSG